jgi:endoglucanase
MKKLLLTIIIIGLFACDPITSDTNHNFEVKRGTNVGHWLSQSKRRGLEREQYITKSDIETVVEMGLDHIRLPIDEEQMWDEEGNRNEEAFTLMMNCIDWSMESNIKVIIDLHILRSHHFNAEVKPLWTDPAEQDKFYDLWRDLSNALKAYPNNMLAYELMNEAVADDPELWNNLLKNAYNVIRELEPERTIVIGSNNWQSYDTFDDLKVPANDPHILLSFHYYHPMILTHYNASWTEYRNYSGPVHYPGILLTEEEYNNLLEEEMRPALMRCVNKEFNKDIILEMWQQPIRKAKELGLPLYCGEFGVYFDAPESDMLRWYEDMVQLFEENDIAYANWNFKSSSFGLLDNEGKRYEALIRIMSPK